MTGAVHKGDQWKVDPSAVDEWLAGRAARQAEQRRLGALREAERKAEEERQAAARYKAEMARRRQEQEAEERRDAELQQLAEEERLQAELDAAYSVCFRLALKASGVAKGPRWMESPEAKAFLAEWPNGTLGGRPSWWQPPPGLIAAMRAEAAKPLTFPYTEPDYRALIPRHIAGRRWPWRSEPCDEY